MLTVGLVIDSWVLNGVIITDAEARIGRPMTPNSVAGVSRRTTRRAIRRTSIYMASLPTGCTTVIIEGTSLYQCGGTYYQSHSNQYVVVNVD
ncbi:MAG: DUF6515 family protein [Gammaproteobacteria bacterium]